MNLARKKLKCDAKIPLGVGSVIPWTSCQSMAPIPIGDEVEGRRLAERAGWKISELGDFCPSHRSQG